MAFQGLHNLINSFRPLARNVFPHSAEPYLAPTAEPDQHPNPSVLLNAEGNVSLYSGCFVSQEKMDELVSAAKQYDFR